MLRISQTNKSVIHAQRGVAAVEFAIIATLFFTLLFGIFEFGRLFYVFNSAQEVTRRAAREAAVRWVNTENQNDAINIALFGASALPAGAEINAGKIIIDYRNSNGGPIGALPASHAANIEACLSGSTDCVAYVRVRIIGATYVPMAGLFTFLTIPIPESTVIMPAESLGYGD